MHMLVMPVILMVKEGSDIPVSSQELGSQLHQVVYNKSIDYFLEYLPWMP